MVAVNLDFIFIFQSAAHDHDYLSLPFTEYWVDEAIKVHVLSSLFEISHLSHFINCS